MTEEQIKIKETALTFRVIVFLAVIVNFVLSSVRVAFGMSVHEFAMHMILLFIINKFFVSLVDIWETRQWMKFYKSIDNTP